MEGKNTKTALTLSILRLQIIYLFSLFLIELCIIAKEFKHRNLDLVNKILKTNLKYVHRYFEINNHRKYFSSVPDQAKYYEFITNGLICFK